MQPCKRLSRKYDVLLLIEHIFFALYFDKAWHPLLGLRVVGSACATVGMQHVKPPGGQLAGRPRALRSSARPSRPSPDVMAGFRLSREIPSLLGDLGSVGVDSPFSLIAASTAIFVVHGRAGKTFCMMSVQVQVLL